MKYIIIGQQCSGKSHVIDFLREREIKCGLPFSNLQIPEDHDPSLIYNADRYEYYSTKDIMEVFENKAYIFIQELTSPYAHPAMGFKYMEGLSQWDWQQNQVFAMSPDQLLSMNTQALGQEEICFVWLDSTKSIRQARHHLEGRKYSFSERELIEKPYTNDLVKFIYGFGEEGPKVLYFTNEEPERAGCIVYTLIQHPELLPIYTQYFN